jgi:uncharacterized protein YqhQ
MASFHYGGQALIEGVLMRGRNALAIALRHPDGSIVWATERLDLGLRARRALKMPFLRGLVVLYDTLVTGTRWLVRSATVQALALEEGEGRAATPGSGGATAAFGGLLRTLALLTGPALCAVDGAGGDAGDAERAAPDSYTDPDGASTSTASAEQGLGKGYTVAVGGMLLLSLLIGIGIFFLLPLLLAQATAPVVGRGLGLQLSEGVIRVAIFIGYLLLMSRMGDVRRTFQYHGAEHMSIHTLEGGDALTVDAARKYPTAHPRCGTEFLVVVVIVSILAFALVGSQSPLILLGSRVLLIPVIAAVSYEILQLGARHRGRAVVRWLWSPGIWVQAITTKQPTDDMIEVAIVSLERAIIADGGEIPAGSTAFACRRLDPMAADGTGPAAPLRSSEGTPKVNPEGIDS